MGLVTEGIAVREEPKQTEDDESVLTGSLVPSCQDVSPDHGPHPQQTHQHGHKVDQLVASLQEEPGQHHQHRDHEAVQQLKRRQ